MKVRIILSLSLMLFFIQASAFAISGQSVYDKYIQVEKKMDKSIKSMVMVVEMNSSGALTETTIYKKGKKTRVESVIKKSPSPMMGAAGQKNIVIDDGVTMTVFSPMGKMTNPSEGAEELNRKTANVRYVGKESVSGVKCHKIKVSYQDGGVETLWVSAKDSVLVKEVDEDGTSIVNSDFRKVKGFSMPHMTRTYHGEGLESTSRVKSLKLGAKISDSKFDPAKVKGFKASRGGGIPSPAKNNEAGGAAMNIMEMAMEIQKLYQNGEDEKAKALEKKMQKMIIGQ